MIIKGWVSEVSNFFFRRQWCALLRADPTSTTKAITSSRAQRITISKSSTSPTVKEAWSRPPSTSIRLTTTASSVWRCPAITSSRPLATPASRSGTFAHRSLSGPSTTRTKTGSPASAFFRAVKQLSVVADQASSSSGKQHPSKNNFEKTIYSHPRPQHACNVKFFKDDLSGLVRLLTHVGPSKVVC